MLKTDSKRKRSILTLGGTITYSRNSFRGADEQSRQYLKDVYHATSICPVDDYLGTSNLPFRMTCNAALKVARIALDCPTLAVAEEHVSEAFGTIVSDDRIRQILLFIARILRKEKESIIANVLENYSPANVVIEKRRGRPSNNAYFLCMEVTQFRESIFICRTYKVSCLDGAISRKHLNYSYSTVSEYKKVLLSEALLHGLETARKLIVITDGTDNVNDLCKEVFPYAEYIISLLALGQQVLTLGTQVVKHYSNQEYRINLFYKYAMKHIESGNWEKIFTMDEIRRHTETPSLTKAIHAFTDYMERNRKLMTYDIFLQRGYPIGHEIPSEEQALFEAEKLSIATRLWSRDLISDYLLLYSEYLSGDWYSHVVPLVRKSYATSIEPI